MQAWLAKRGGLLVIVLVVLWMLQPSLRLLTRRLDDRLTIHARHVLNSATLPAPSGTRYAPLSWADDSFTVAMRPRGPMVGGGGSYGQRGLINGLASYSGHWHCRLHPTLPVSDDTSLCRLCGEVRDFYVRLLTVREAETHLTDDQAYRLWTGLVADPAKRQRSVRQFVNVHVFGSPAKDSIIVSVDLTGDAVGLSSCFSARSLF
ncbi:MAG: hypothetical protein ACUVX8_03920 [Candidatus Zipacnadales bacterium]